MFFFKFFSYLHISNPSLILDTDKLNVEGEDVNKHFIEKDGVEGPGGRIYNWTTMFTSQQPIVLYSKTALAGARQW